MKTRDGGMRAPKARRGQAPVPTRPLAHLQHYGAGAHAADGMLGTRPYPGSVDRGRPMPAGAHSPSALGIPSSTSPSEVGLGQPVQYGSPAHSPKHPGFKSVQSKISKKEGVSKDRAGAMLAAASRGASKSAKKANPRLKRVKG